MALDSYREALRRPGVARVVVTSLVARAPNGMASLAMLLLISRHHGYAGAGAAVGVMVACTCISNPVLSRIAAERGARRILVFTAVGYAAATLTLSLWPHASYAAAVICCAWAGLSTPPVVAVVRGLWPRLYAAEEVQALYGLEATAQELIFIVGPALVAVLAAVGGAATALAVTGLLALGGTLALSAAPAFATRPMLTARARHRLLTATRLPLFLALAFTLTVGFNMCDIAIVAFVSGRRANAAAGIVFAVWSAGSMLGGLLFGGRSGVATEAGVARSCLAISVGLAAAAAAPGRVGLAVILFLGAIVVAPGLARLYGAVASIVPDRAATEAFAWIGVGLLAGASAGSSLGGFSVDAIGPRPTFLLASIPSMVFALVVLVRARSLTRQTEVHPLPS